MESRAKLLGHAAHAILIVFPLGLLATAVIFDVIYLFTNNPNLALVSFWMIAAGVVGGFVAAPFGWWDWLAIPNNTRAKAVGLTHGVGNVIVLLLFIISWWISAVQLTLHLLQQLYFSLLVVRLWHCLQAGSAANSSSGSAWA
jgi:uncharacterized membrane protein